MIKSTILTLDAGGTNLVFKAVSEGIILPETVTLPAHSDTL
ncbi:MAG: ROK family protein, partial [Bacteroidetes bacterium]